MKRCSLSSPASRAFRFLLSATVYLFSGTACEDRSPKTVAAPQPTEAAKTAALPAVPGSQPEAAPEAAGWKSGPIHRGAPFTVETTSALAAVLKSPAEFEGKPIKLSGEVARVCEKKGCWMELRASADDPHGVRIRFKDYAFFVPLDSQGAQAMVEGVLKVETLDAAAAEHLAQEGAKVSKDAAGSAVEIGLLASAVELSKNVAQP